MMKIIDLKTKHREYQIDKSFYDKWNMCYKLNEYDVNEKN